MKQQTTPGAAQAPTRPSATITMTPSEDYEFLVCIGRDGGRGRSYSYSRWTPASRERFWRLLDQCTQGEWQNRYRFPATTPEPSPGPWRAQPGKLQTAVDEFYVVDATGGIVAELWSDQAKADAQFIADSATVLGSPLFASMNHAIYPLGREGWSIYLWTPGTTGPRRGSSSDRSNQALYAGDALPEVMRNAAKAIREIGGGA